ncbi:MAG: metal-dependent transcriptional regulator [Candidatus Latescibacteria bacterium]|nr:metal-dependent transcriptional regulator [Candidatus Latescibacterota bacterium]
MLSQAVEDYLKTIYKLQNGESTTAKVTTSLIAERMEVAPASATSMIKKLAQMRLLRHTPYRGVELTPAGENIALEVIRHHRLLELYLSEALGYPWDQVDAEADRLEHAISEEFEDRIDQALGYPRIGAHGEPIPTKQGDIDTSPYQCLAQLPVGRAAVIRRVSDRNPEMLRYMESMGLKLGTSIEIREKEPFKGPLLVKIDRDRTHSLSLEVADHIFVEADIQNTPPAD